MKPLFLAIVITLLFPTASVIEGGASIPLHTYKPVKQLQIKTQAHVELASKMSVASDNYSLTDTSSINHESLMAQAGISPGDYQYVEYIVQHESGWNPYDINPTSGACNLGQELPCGKSGCSLSDSICELKWMAVYAVDRYGSWAGAYQFWVNSHWW